LSNSEYISKISVNLAYMSGAPSDITVRLETDSNGRPSDNLISEDAQATISGFSNSLYEWKDFEFDNPLELSANVPYHIVLELANESSDAKYKWARKPNADLYNKGIHNVQTTRYPNWYSYPKDDLAFRVYEAQYVDDISLENQGPRVINDIKESYEQGIDTHQIINSSNAASQIFEVDQTTTVENISLYLWHISGANDTIEVRLHSDYFITDFPARLWQTE
jgi:hypothetical protein